MTDPDVLPAPRLVGCTCTGHSFDLLLSSSSSLSCDSLNDTTCKENNHNHHQKLCAGTTSPHGTLLLHPPSSLSIRNVSSSSVFVRKPNKSSKRLFVITTFLLLLQSSSFVLAESNNNDNVKNNENDEGNIFQRFFMMMKKKQQKPNTNNSNNHNKQLPEDVSDRHLVSTTTVTNTIRDVDSSSSTSIASSLESTTTDTTTGITTTNAAAICPPCPEIVPAATTIITNGPPTTCFCTADQITNLQSLLNNTIESYNLQLQKLVDEKNQLVHDKRTLQEQIQIQKDESIKRYEQISNASENAIKVYQVQEEYNQRHRAFQQQCDNEISSLKNTILQNEITITKLKDDHTIATDILQQRQDKTVMDIELYYKEKMNRIEKLYNDEMNVLQTKLLELYAKPIHEQNIVLVAEKEQYEQLYNTILAKYEGILTDRTEQLQIYLDENLDIAATNKSAFIVQNLTEHYTNELVVASNKYQQLTTEYENYQSTSKATILELKNKYQQFQIESNATLHDHQTACNLTIVNHIANNTLLQHQNKQMRSAITMLEETNHSINRTCARNMEQAKNDYEQLQTNHTLLIETMKQEHTKQLQTIEQQADNAMVELEKECSTNTTALKEYYTEEIAKLQNQLQLTKQQNSAVSSKYEQSKQQVRELQVLHRDAFQESIYWTKLYHERSYINTTYISHGVQSALTNFTKTVSDSITRTYNSFQERRFVRLVQRLYTTYGKPHVDKHIRPKYELYVVVPIESMIDTILKDYVPALQSDLQKMITNGSKEYNLIKKQVQSVIDNAVSVQHSIKQQISSSINKSYDTVARTYQITICPPVLDAIHKTISSSKGALHNYFEASVLPPIEYSCYETDSFYVDILEFVVVIFISLYYRFVFRSILRIISLLYGIVRWVFFKVPLRIAIVFCTMLLGETSKRTNDIPEIDIISPLNISSGNIDKLDAEEFVSDTNDKNGNGHPSIKKEDDEVSEEQ